MEARLCSPIHNLAIVSTASIRPSSNDTLPHGSKQRPSRALLAGIVGFSTPLLKMSERGNSISRSHRRMMLGPPSLASFIEACSAASPSSSSALHSPFSLAFSPFQAKASTHAAAPPIATTPTTMAAVAVSSSWPDMLAGVILESKRVVAAHSRHFLALTVLFLVPLSCLLVAAPSLPPFSTFSSLSPHPLPPPRSLLRLRQNHHVSYPSLADTGLALAYAAAALLLALSAATAVAGSVHRGFFGRPVKLLPALRSLPGPLARLVLTFLASLLPLAAVLLLLSSLLILSLHHLSRFPHAATLTWSLFAAITILSLIYLQLSWSLAGAIAVMESSWGFGSLRRSAHLVQGMRWAVLCLYVFFVAGIGVMLWGFSLWRAGETAGNWREVLPVVARTVFGSGITAVLLLYGLVTNVVLYMYCKALHGELAGEIAEEFAWQYVCLPFDDRKVPHVVSVIRQ